MSIASAVGYSFRKSMEQSPSWEANVPRILWNPCSQEPATCPYLVPDPFQTICPGSRLCFYGEEILAPRSTTVFIDCSLLLIQYILTYPPHLEAVPFICLSEDTPCLGENSRLQFENATIS